MRKTLAPIIKNMKLRLLLKNKMKFFHYVLIILIVCSIQSCEKKQDEFTIEDKAVFEAEINGEKTILIESDSLIDIDTYINWNPSRQRSHGVRDYVIDIWQMNLGKFIMFDSPTTNHISINFVNHFYNWEYDENGDVTKEQFENILSNGTKDYSINYKDFPGILIEWFDANGEKWTSSKVFLSGDSIPNVIDNNENKFNINYSKFQNDLSDERSYYQYLDISFQCRLYNKDGENIMIKNGKFKCMYRLFKII